MFNWRKAFLYCVVIQTPEITQTSSVKIELFQKHSKIGFCFADMTHEMRQSMRQYGAKMRQEVLAREPNLTQKILVFALTMFKHTKVAFIGVVWTSKGHKREMFWST